MTDTPEPTSSAADDREYRRAVRRQVRMERIRNRPAWRAAKIVGTIGGMRLSYAIGKRTDARYSDEQAEKRQSARNRRNAERVYKAVTQLEGVTIKVGQLMSGRADALPPETIEVLSRLQDEVPPKPFVIVRKRIEQEFGRPLTEVFPEFNTTPEASASLGQVHAARIPAGDRVAVKIQYPGIEKKLDIDLTLLEWSARRMGTNLDLPFDILAEEFRKYLTQELDYIGEAHNCRSIRANFKNIEEVVVPAIYDDFSTRRVLTMEFIDGVKISDTERVADMKVDTQHAAQVLTEALCKMILLDGFFHADPHPGNLFLLPDGRLALLDFGLAREMSDGVRQGFARLSKGILLKDRALMDESFAELGFITKHGDTETLAIMAHFFLGRLAEGERPFLQQGDRMRFRKDIQHAMKNNPVTELPREFVLMMRVLNLLGGAGKLLDSRVNIRETMLRYIDEALAPRPALHPPEDAELHDKRAASSSTTSSA